MTQHLDIEELQNLLKTVVEETTAITEKLATKASKILSKHEPEKTKDVKLSGSERSTLQKEIKKPYRKAITVKASALQVIALQRKKNKIIGHSNGGIKKKISYNKLNLKTIKMLSDF